jgi:hypothetical protein
VSAETARLLHTIISVTIAAPMWNDCLPQHDTCILTGSGLYEETHCNSKRLDSNLFLTPLISQPANAPNWAHLPEIQFNIIQPPDIPFFELSLSEIFPINILHAFLIPTILDTCPQPCSNLHFIIATIAGDLLKRQSKSHLLQST